MQLFKVTVLNLHVIMMKPENKLTISAGTVQELDSIAANVFQKLSQLAIMSVVAMESQCMKTIMKHLVNKRDFILFDHKTRCKSLQ